MASFFRFVVVEIITYTLVQLLIINYYVTLNFENDNKYKHKLKMIFSNNSIWYIF